MLCDNQGWFIRIMLSAADKQFSLQADGHICYQADASNPLPGVPVAVIRKGDTVLTPVVEILDSVDLDKNEAQKKVQQSLDVHLQQVLAPLFALKAEHEGEIKPACSKIADCVYDALGTVPRATVEEFATQLDQDDRRVLRSWKIRLGPILVFQPDLNKPAAVKLRGLLWNLYHDKPLPADVPPDGIVSLRIDSEKSDPDFYRSIGYPLYGARAIRIDMLDRVINAVYDLAEGGKFQAQHQMAEWLGCSIDDLYQVLEAMGHKKIYDPLDEPQAEGQEAEKSEEVSEKQDKPELATFRLKKGKAFEQSRPEKSKKPKRAGKRNKKTNKTPKITEVGPKPKLEDSPFAILQQLKVNGDAN